MFNDIIIIGGMSIDCIYCLCDGLVVGGYLISGLVCNIIKCGIDVLLDILVEEILMCGDEVSGVCLINDEKEVIEVQIKSIVVVIGGFSVNSVMVVKYCFDFEGFVIINYKGVIGSGIVLLECIGVGIVDMGEIQIYLIVEQQILYLIFELICGGGVIFVNQQGNCFFNEMEICDKVLVVIIVLLEYYVYIVFDEYVWVKNKVVDEYIVKGFVISVSLLWELVEKLGMDYYVFFVIFECYNGVVEKQYDEQFGWIIVLCVLINEGLFYVICIVFGVYYIMGGVIINIDGEVLNVVQQLICGVYVVGEVVGGIYGGNCIGGNVVVDIIIFGIFVGYQVVKCVRG